MRRIAALLCTFALAGCGGGGGAVPAGSGAAGDGAKLSPKGSNVTYETGMLYAGSQKTVALYTLIASGPAMPRRTISFAPVTGSATAVSVDGTVYETVNGADLQIYAPDASGTALPEQRIVNAGSNVALVGDGIDVITHTSTAYTVKTLPYAGGDTPRPVRTLTGSGHGGPASVASDYNDNLYVAHDALITVFPAASKGAAKPMRQITGVAPNAFDVTVGMDGTIYLASNARLGGQSSIDEWEPGNNGSTPTRTLGPFPWSGFGRMVAVTIDGNGWLYVGFQRQDGSPDTAGNPTPGTNYVNVYGQAVSGLATPLRTLSGVVAPGETFRSLAVGPDVVSPPGGR